MHPSKHLLSAGIRYTSGRLAPRNTPFPLLNTLLPSITLPTTTRTSRRQQSSPSNRLAPTGPQPATPAPNSTAPYVRGSVPLLAKPMGFGILQLTRYTSAFLPLVYAFSVPGLADLYGSLETAGIFGASFLPLLFVRWATAPYVYAAEWLLPQGIRGREAVKAHLARAPVSELGEIAVRRLGGGGKIGGMGGSWSKIGGKWAKIRVADLRRKRERGGVVDYVDRTGEVKFYFGGDVGRVRERWMLGELLGRVKEWEGPEKV